MSTARIGSIGMFVLSTVAVTSVVTLSGKQGSVLTTPGIPYMDDAPYVGHPCREPSSILHYKVFYPAGVPDGRCP